MAFGENACIVARRAEQGFLLLLVIRNACSFEKLAAPASEDDGYCRGSKVLGKLRIAMMERVGPRVITFIIA